MFKDGTHSSHLFPFLTQSNQTCSCSKRQSAEVIENNFSKVSKLLIGRGRLIKDKTHHRGGARARYDGSEAEWERAKGKGRMGG